MPTPSERTLLISTHYDSISWRRSVLGCTYLELVLYIHIPVCFDRGSYKQNQGGRYVGDDAKKCMRERSFFYTIDCSTRNKKKIVNFFSDEGAKR